jgi:hypothetical protein
MRYVSLRDFQLNAGEYLKDLPIMLTRYNLPVAKVVEITQEDENLAKSQWTHQVAEPEVKDSVPTVPGATARKCSVYQCNEEATATGKIYNPDEGEFVDAPMCKAHAAKSLKEFAKGF